MDRCWRRWGRRRTTEAPLEERRIKYDRPGMAATSSPSPVSDQWTGPLTADVPEGAVPAGGDAAHCAAGANGKRQRQRSNLHPHPSIHPIWIHSIPLGTGATAGLARCWRPKPSRLQCICFTRPGYSALRSTARARHPRRICRQHGNSRPSDAQTAPTVAVSHGSPRPPFGSGCF